MSSQFSLNLHQPTTYVTSPISQTSHDRSPNPALHSSRTTTSSEHSPPPPEFPSWETLESDDSLVASNAPKYDFRLGPRDPSKVLTLTWVDQDATATYDPKEKRDPWLNAPVNCILRPKRPRVERAFNYLEYKAKRPRLVTWQRGRIEGRRKVITFVFTSDHGKAILRAFGAKLDNWPGIAFTLPNGDPDWEAWWNSHEPVPESEFRLPGTYHLRDRAALVPLYRDDDDDFGLENVTLGHPAARGCKACFQLGCPCPLLDEGSRYPCALCIEDEIECELIIEPQVKARCNSCSSKKIVCPFGSDGGQRGPCKPCQDASVPCIAGPKSGRTRMGPSLDAEYVSDANLKLGRSFVSCTECRQPTKWCSLENKRERPPCKTCRLSNSACTFEPLNSRAVTRKHRRREISPKPAPSTKSTTLKRTSSKAYGQSSLKTIITKLAHPIYFNYRAKESEIPACHWCDDLVYGLLGLGEVRVEVIDKGDKKGYIEVFGGHRSQGHLPSRMCYSCTLERAVISACGVHELEPIVNMDPEDFAYDIIMEFMMPGMAASAPFRWCSVCPSPAFFRCCKKMDAEMVDEEGCEGMGGGNGCGLLLCEYCAVTLVGEHDGHLDALIDAMSIDKANEGYGLRADVDFLHPAGELVRRVAAV